MNNKVLFLFICFTIILIANIINIVVSEKYGIILITSLYILYFFISLELRLFWAKYLNKQSEIEIKHNLKILSEVKKNLEEKTSKKSPIDYV